MDTRRRQYKRYISDIHRYIHIIVSEIFTRSIIEFNDSSSITEFHKNFIAILNFEFFGIQSLSNVQYIQNFQVYMWYLMNKSKAVDSP